MRIVKPDFFNIVGVDIGKKEIYLTPEGKPHGKIKKSISESEAVTGRESSSGEKNSNEKRKIGSKELPAD